MGKRTVVSVHCAWYIVETTKQENNMWSPVAVITVGRGQYIFDENAGKWYRDNRVVFES